MSRATSRGRRTQIVVPFARAASVAVLVRAALCALIRWIVADARGATHGNWQWSIVLMQFDRLIVGLQLAIGGKDLLKGAQRICRASHGTTCNSLDKCPLLVQ